MADVQLTMGDAKARFRFGMDTAAYQSFQRQTRINWPASDQIGTHPARQFTGYDQRTTLRGKVFTAFRGGLRQIDELHAMALAARPYLLTDGNGLVHGQWVITNVTETKSKFQVRGNPRVIDFTMTLDFYGG